MGKNDFLTPKAIANRIKAKGLQKLRWYCQMCQKQCRDENGFKCHLTSESHKRQMEIFGQNPMRVVEGYSEEFESSFMEHLRRAHPFSRVSANVVYNEYINDKYHVHMNSTKWLTLTEFVKYLGREGKCKVEETPKGWYITRIHKDPAEELGEKKRAKRERAELEEEERHARALEEQIARAQAVAAAQQGEETEPSGAVAGSELNREQLDKPLGFALAAAARPGGAGPAAGAAFQEDAKQQKSVRPVAAFDEADRDGLRGGSRGGGAGAAAQQQPAKRSKLEELMEKDRLAKQQREQQAAAAAATAAGGPPRGLSTWLTEGIIVKVMSKALSEHGYYKKKGLVKRVQDKFIGEIEMLDSGDVVRVDQAELETVIPQPGGAVLVVGGQYKGARATLQDIDTKKYRAQVKLRSGPHEGETVRAEYEDICKMQGR
ncbi:hypothetical protein N2152v2_006510 [Parachlorella kessleri]